MKTQLLLLVFLCAFQCGFTLFGMENSQPAPVAQPQSAPVQQADQGLAWYRRMATAFAAVAHTKLGAQSSFYGLPASDIQDICERVRESMTLRCSKCSWHVVTLDRHVFNDHMAIYHPSTIVSRDASGNFSAGTLNVNDFPNLQ